MSYNFKPFLGKKQLGDKKNPIITIQAGGNLGLNRSAFEALGSPDKIIFMYDEDNKAVAVAPAKGDELHAYMLRKQQQSDSYVVTAKAFLAYVDYPIGQARTFTPEREGDILIIRLGDEDATNE